MQYRRSFKLRLDKGCTACHQLLAPTIVRTDLSRLAHSYDGTKFNASIIRHRGRLLMAYRCGQGGSQIYVSELGEDLTPGRFALLPLDHAFAQSSREDPRLFSHRGQLCVSYIGVIGDPGNGRPGSTHQLFARLRDDLSVETICYPQYAARNRTWEKNWAFFDHDGDLHAVYTIQPHVVLRIDGNEAWPAEHRGAPALPWRGGMLRGGAPPVRIGDEYWCWFHGKAGNGTLTPWGPSQTTVYSMGIYCFEARPPFRPTRITSQPLVWGDERTRGPCWCAVVFPCGAIFEDRHWTISCGIHDREIHVYRFDHGAVEKAMVKV